MTLIIGITNVSLRCKVMSRVNSLTEYGNKNVICMRKVKPINATEEALIKNPFDNFCHL